MITFSLISRWQTYRVIINITLLLIKICASMQTYNCNVNAEENSVKSKRNFSRLLYLTDLLINQILYTL